jgi:hypothetical protein
MLPHDTSHDARVVPLGECVNLIVEGPTKQSKITITISIYERYNMRVYKGSFKILYD